MPCSIFADINLSAETIAAWISILTFGVGALTWLLRRIHVNYQKYQRLEQRVNRLWGFYMSRGFVEALSKGYMTQRDNVSPSPRWSPMLAREVRGMFDPIAEELQELYSGKCEGMSEEQVMEEIENKYRDWLVNNICLPLNVHDGACLQMALQVAKENIFHRRVPSGKDD